jgi:hypothetical protein
MWKKQATGERQQAKGPGKDQMAGIMNNHILYHILRGEMSCVAFAEP